MAYRETEKMRQRKAQARQRIIDSAWACVASGGFRNARITRIAGLAGVATGTIYRHFESREDLFAEIFRTATQREVDKVAEALHGPADAAARLEAALRRFADLLHMVRNCSPSSAASRQARIRSSSSSSLRDSRRYSASHSLPQVACE